MSDAAILSAGHTYAFLRPKLFVSVKTEKVAKDLLEKASKSRGTSGKLAVIDSALATLHSKIIKKDWDGAFMILAALTLFNEFEDYWPMWDDGKRIELTNKAYGASLVTVLHALKKDGRLDVSHFPGLETTLKGAATWGEEMKSISCNSDYDLVCKAIGARLFRKSEADVASEKARLDAWLATRSQEEQGEFYRMIQEEAEDPNGEDSDEEDESEPWHSGGSELEEDMKRKDFVLARVWKDYRDYLDRRR
ncbi:hypothetical protein C8R43DRAFT_399368 [Mycena crocata]|nr:hypothetical protein C8R43DRAFT_399368 [Mycena crocata]